MSFFYKLVYREITKNRDPCMQQIKGIDCREVLPVNAGVQQSVHTLKRSLERGVDAKFFMDTQLKN